MNLQQLKKEQQDKYNQLITDCSMFFAFSNDQFAENKTPLEPGEKYISIGAGGYMPKSKLQKWIDGSKEIEQWHKAEVKANNLRKNHIIDELENHEAFYTYEIEDTLTALGNDYTEEEVKKVFWAEVKRHEKVNA